MSAHHRTTEALKFAARRRKQLKAQLPLPCVNFAGRCSGWVEDGEVWDVAHIVDVAKGGEDTEENTGVAHRFCNRAAGGRTAQAKAKATKAADRRLFNL